MYERSVEDAEYRRERAAQRRIEMEERRARAEEKRARAAEERRIREEELENEKILRMDKKVSGVMINTALNQKKEKEAVEKPEMTFMRLRCRYRKILMRRKQPGR